MSSVAKQINTSFTSPVSKLGVNEIDRDLGITCHHLPDNISIFIQKASSKGAPSAVAKKRTYQIRGVYLGVMLLQ